MLRRDRSVYRSGFARRQARFDPTESARESGSNAFSESSVLPERGEGGRKGEIWEARDPSY